jgi:hypothetical protein
LRGSNLIIVACLVILVTAWSVPAHAGPKTDTVILINGDHITGEIKSLSRGRLTYSTDDMKTIFIDWIKVARVESPNIFEIETQGFKRIYGSLAPTEEDGWVKIETGDSTFTQRIDRVVRITPLKGKFWRRLKILLDLGYSFTSVDNQQTFNFGTEISSRTERYLRQLSASTFSTNRNDEPGTSRSLASITSKRFFENRPRDYFSSLVSMEQNDELGLDHRYTGGAGLGRRFVQSNLFVLGLESGLMISQESFTGTSSGDLGWDRGEVNATDDYNLDLYLGTDLSVARWHDPEIDFTMTMVIFPSVTTSGRYRGRLDSRLRYEVFSDFFVGLSGFMDYDNKPPVAGVEKADFSAALTVGWAFNK